MNHAILTVLGKDQPGIIANVTKILYKEGCNLEDISMTVLEGQFAMIVIVKGSSKQEKIEAALSKNLKGLSFHWKALKTKLSRGEKHAKGTQPYIVSVCGKDRTGIVHETSKVLAGYKLNITDLNSKILGKGKKAVYAMIPEVDIPTRFSIKKLELGLQRMSKRLKVDVAINPVQLITA